MKKVVSVVTSLSVAAALLVGCGGSGSGSEATTAPAQSAEPTAKPAEKVTLKMFTFGEGVQQMLQDMSAKYKAKNPNVTVEVEVVSNEYDSVLKTKLNSGDVPDIFMTQGYATNKIYKDIVLDLTDEPFIQQVEDSAKTAATLDGRILGVPVSVQSYGFIYNKDVFAKAGITEIPKTYAELEAVAEKLKASGVTPFANQYKEWWVLKHIASQNMAAEEGNYPGTAKEISEGKKSFKDLPQFAKVFDLIDITLKYGQDKALETDFNAGLALVANGQAGMVHQGNWAESGLTSVNANVKLGYIPVPVGDDKSKAKLMVDSSVLLRINKDSKNAEAAKEFMNFVVTDYIKTNGWLQEIPVVKGAKAPTGMLSAETMQYSANKQTYPWVQGYWPDGFDVQLGQFFQEYIAGIKTKEQVMDDLTSTWVKLSEAAK